MSDNWFDDILFFIVGLLIGWQVVINQGHEASIKNLHKDLNKLNQMIEARSK